MTEPSVGAKQSEQPVVSDQLDAFRRQCWGKRDMWAWMVGVCAPLLLGLAFRFRHDSLPVALVGVGVAGVCFCFWLGMSWTRPALIASPFLLGFVDAVSSGRPWQLALGMTLLLSGVAVVIYTDARNKLFFKMEVSPERLRKAWNFYGNNPVAWFGFLSGLLGVVAFPLAPVAAPVAIVLSWKGLNRVKQNPQATSANGQRTAATIGFFLGVLGAGLFAIFVGILVFKH